MKHKKFAAILMAMVMALCLLAGCGNSESGSAQGNGDKAQSGGNEASESNSKAPENAADTSAPSQGSAEGGETQKAADPGQPAGGAGGDGATGDYNVTWEDTADITVMFCSMGPVPSGLKAVEDAINVITEEEIDTHVTLNVVEVGNYDQQANLLLSSGEQVDLMITMPGGPASLSTMSSQKQLTDITEIVDQHAPSIKSGIGDYLKGTTIDGKLYGVTAYKNFISAIYVVMRTDVLEDLGLLEKAQNMTSFKEYEEILEAVKGSEKWSYLSGIGPSDGHGNILPVQNANLDDNEFSGCGYFDNLGDTQFIVNTDPTGACLLYTSRCV